MRGYRSFESQGWGLLKYLTLLSKNWIFQVSNPFKVPFHSLRQEWKSFWRCNVCLELMWAENAPWESFCQKGKLGEWKKKLGEHEQKIGGAWTNYWITSLNLETTSLNRQITFQSTDITMLTKFYKFDQNSQVQTAQTQSRQFQQQFRLTDFHLAHRAVSQFLQFFFYFVTKCDVWLWLLEDGPW